MTIVYWYAQALANAFGSSSAGNAPNIDFLSDSLYLALMTASYTPNMTTDAFWSTLVANEHANGNGYATNGVALATKTLTVTAANSWGTQWAGTTAYTLGKVVRPTAGNGYLYRCVVAGTSSGSAPTWPTVIGTTVTDGTVTWVCAGRSIIQFDADDVSWAAATLTTRYGVIYDRTPATDATRPLLMLVDFEATQSVTGATFTVQFDSQGIDYILVP